MEDSKERYLYSSEFAFAPCMITGRFSILAKDNCELNNLCCSKEGGVFMPSKPISPIREVGFDVRYVFNSSRE